MCNLPDVRLTCVTYKSNDMKVGDRVSIKGGYNRVDPKPYQSQGISSGSSGPPAVRDSR